MFAVLIAVLSLQPLQPIRNITTIDSPESSQVAYARDDQYEYLALPDGLYRSTKLADPNVPLEQIAFAGRTVHSVAVNDGKLYAIVGNSTSPVSPEHAFLRSLDHGATFTPLDQNLLDCSVPPCGYLVAEDMAFAQSRIFLSAGGNVVASGDDGLTWNVLYGLTDEGKPVAQLCPVEFSRAGDVLLLGGECPLDVGWVSRGRLRPDLLGWADEPQPVIAPFLENRNVQWIRHLDAETVLASVEGGILRSTDGGATFDWTLHYDLDDPFFYPYIWEMVASTQHTDLLVAGGFDKKSSHAFLNWSRDGGRSWNEASELLGRTSDNSAVSMLAEDREGNILVMLHSAGKYTLGRVGVVDGGKRRAVRK